MLEWRDLTLRFGDKEVLRACSYTAAAGESVALMGPSGCGKTSLLRIVLGLQQPDSGCARTDARRIAAVFQEPRLLPWCTAAENVNAALGDRPETMPQAYDWLRRLALAEAADELPAALSGGMQQRVALARALAVKPDLLVLDEPFKGLDSELHARVLACVREAMSGGTILLATHNRREAEALGCRILRCCEGGFYPEVSGAAGEGEN